MTLNCFESCLASIGEKLGLGNAVLEWISELGGVIFLIVRLAQMNENKCHFKIAQENSLESSQISTSYYIICEDKELNDISLSQCSEYSSEEDAKYGQEFLNNFSKSYLLAIGIIWILVQFFLMGLKCCYEQFNKETSLKNKKALNCIEGIEFLLTFVIASLIIPISGINYENNCGQYYFTIFSISPSFIYFTTYFFLVLGIIVYFVMVSSKFANPVWALFFLPFLVVYCLFGDEKGKEEKKNKTEEEKKSEEDERNGKLLIMFIFGLIYIAVVFFNFASFVSNSHWLMVIFFCGSLVFELFGVFKSEKEIQDEQKKIDDQYRESTQKSQS